jgi:hypothetical protein
MSNDKSRRAETLFLDALAVPMEARADLIRSRAAGAGNGSCESLAGEESAYQFCYERDQSFATGPSVPRPVSGFSAMLDSVSASAERSGVVLPGPAARPR